MKKITFICCMVLVLVLGFGFTGKSVHATEKDSLNSQQIKYYKSIEIQKDDTLWSIAEENLNVEYDTVTTYVNELMKINNLATDEIGTGNYLTVYYYDNI